MAKKENFDFDDWEDFDDFGDFEEGMGMGGFKSTTRQGKAREAVKALSGGLVSGVKKNLFTRNFYQTLTKNALPSEYSAALDKTFEAKDAIGDIYDTARRETVDTNDKLTRGVKPIVDKYGDKLPKRMQRPLREWTRNVNSSGKWTPENKEELETVAALNDIFNKREQTKSIKNTSIQSQVQTGIAQTNMSLTSQMLGNQQKMLAYQDQIDAKWKRKTLELQYKQLFVQRKLLDVNEQSLALSKKAFGDIVKNTSLPDMVKAQNSELASRMISEKIYGAAIDRFSKLPYNVLQATTNNITRKMKDGGAELREVLGDVFDNLDDGIEEGSELGEDLGILGALRMGGEMGSENVSSYIAKVLGKRISKKISGNAKVKQGADMLSGGMKRLPRIFGDMVKNEDTGSSFLDMILELTDMKSQLQSRDSIVAKNTSGELDTQVYFDLLTKKSITEIIPGYLTRIHHELRSLRTGDDTLPQLSYDFDKNVFSNDAVLSKRLKDKTISRMNARTLNDVHGELSEKLGLSNIGKGIDGVDPEEIEAIKTVFLKEFSMASINNNDFTLKSLLHEDSSALTDKQKDIYEDFILNQFGIDNQTDIPLTGFKNKLKGKLNGITSHSAEAASAQRDISDALERLQDFIGNPAKMLNMSARKGQMQYVLDTGLVDDANGDYILNKSNYIDALMNHQNPDDKAVEEEKKKTATRRFFDERREQLRNRTNRFRRRTGDPGESDTNEVSPASVNNFKRTFTETRLTNLHSKYGSNDKVITAIQYAQEKLETEDVSSSDLERTYNESKTFRDLVDEAFKETQDRKNKIKTKYGSTTQGIEAKYGTHTQKFKAAFNTQSESAKVKYGPQVNKTKSKISAQVQSIKAKIEARTGKPLTGIDDQELIEAEAIADDFIRENDIDDSDGSVKESIIKSFITSKIDSVRNSAFGSHMGKVKDFATDAVETAKDAKDTIKSKGVNDAPLSAVKILIELGKYTAKAANVLTKPHRNALKLIPWGIKKLIGTVIETTNFSHVKHGLWLKGEKEPRLLATGLMSGRYLNGDGKVIEKPKDIHGDIFDAMSTPEKLIMSKGEYKSGLYDSSGKLIYKPPSLIARARNAIVGLGVKMVKGTTRLMGKAFMGYLNITTKPANWIINRILREDKIDPKLHAELVQLGLTQQTNAKLDELKEAFKEDKEQKFNDKDDDGDRDGNALDIMEDRKNKKEKKRKEKEDKESKKDKDGWLSRLFGKKKGKSDDDDDEEDGMGLGGMMGKLKGFKKLGGLMRNPYVLGALAATGVISYEALTDKSKTENPEDIANMVLPDSLKDSMAARIGVRLGDTLIDKVALGAIRNNAKAAVKLGEWGLRGTKWLDRKTTKLGEGFKNQLNKLGGQVTGLLFGKGARKFVDKLLNADNATPLFRFRMAQYGFKYTDKQAVEAILKFEDDILKSMTVATDTSPARIADAITIEQSAAYFDVSINDQDDLTEWTAWYSNRFRPVFLSNVTVMQRLGYNSKKLHEIDSMMSKKDKLMFISKVNFWRDDTNPHDTNVSPLPTEWYLSYASQKDVNEVYDEQVSEIESMPDDTKAVMEDQQRVKKRENKQLDRAKLRHETTKPSARFDPYAQIDKLSTKTMAKAYNDRKSVNNIKDKSEHKGFGGGGAGQNFASNNATPSNASNPGDPGYNYTVAENGVFGKVLGTVGSALSGMFVQKAHASAFIPEMQYGGASAPMGAKATSQAMLMATTSGVKKPDTQLGSKTSNLMDKPLKAATYARNKAKPKSTGYAAKHIYVALIHAGYKFDQPSRASDFAVSVLPEIGFSKLTRGEKPKAGDITVFTGTMEDKNGHVQIYDGVDWISDYIQPSWSPYTRSIPSYSQWRSDEFAEKGSLSTRKSKAQAKVDAAVSNPDKPVNSSSKSVNVSDEKTDKPKSVLQSMKESTSNFISTLKDKVKNSAVGGFISRAGDGMSNAIASMTGGQKKWQMCVYNAFKTAGFSEQQSRIMTAEIGRENSYNPKYMFAGHADPHSGSNLGMLSWQKTRKTQLISFLKREGVLDSANNIKPSQEALNAQAKFIMWEMNNTEKAAGSKFLPYPNISYKDGVWVVGKHYIRWRIDKAPYAAPGAANRDAFYKMLLKQLNAKDGDNTSSAAPPTGSTVTGGTQTGIQKAVGAVNGASAKIVNGVKSLNPFASDPNIDPKTREDNGSATSTGGNVPSSSKPAKAAKAARSKALTNSIGYCARYVRIALQTAGYKFTPMPSAYQYAQGTLSSAGFGQISTSTPYQVGDIIVIAKSRKHVHGHICIWDGKNWISDFIQRKWNPYSTPQSYTLWRDRNHLNGASASSGPTSGSGSDSSASTASTGGTFGETGAVAPAYNPVTMKYNDYTGIDEEISNSWKNGTATKTTPTMTDDIKEVPTKDAKKSSSTKPGVKDPDKTTVKPKKSEQIASSLVKATSSGDSWKPDFSLGNGFAASKPDGVDAVVDRDVKEEMVKEQTAKNLTQRMSETETKRANEVISQSNAVLQESLKVQRQMLDKLSSIDKHMLDVVRGQKSRQIVESSNSTTPQDTKEPAPKPVHLTTRAGRNEPMSMSKMI